MTWKELVEKAEHFGYRVENHYSSEYLRKPDVPVSFFDYNDVLFGKNCNEGYIMRDRSYDQMYQIMLALED
jgi:hypothetical protein